jgi:hypothetical protein
MNIRFSWPMKIFVRNAESLSRLAGTMWQTIVELLFSQQLLSYLSNVWSLRTSSALSKVDQPFLFSQVKAVEDGLPENLYLHRFLTRYTASVASEELNESESGSKSYRGFFINDIFQNFKYVRGLFNANDMKLYW